MSRPLTVKEFNQASNKMRKYIDDNDNKYISKGWSIHCLIMDALDEMLIEEKEGKAGLESLLREDGSMMTKSRVYTQEEIEEKLEPLIKDYQELSDGDYLDENEGVTKRVYEQVLQSFNVEV